MEIDKVTTFIILVLAAQTLFTIMDKFFAMGTKIVKDRITRKLIAIERRASEKAWTDGYESGFKAGYDQRMDDELRAKDATQNEEHF